MILLQKEAYRAVILALLFLGVIDSCPVCAQGVFSKSIAGKGETTVIRSNSLEIDNRNKVVSFQGDVEAKRGDMVIRCRKMLIHYHDKEGAGILEKSGFRIERIVASGDVKIDRADGGSATADEVVYYEDEEKLVLNGKPIVKQGEDFVEGSVITLFLKEDRSVVEGSGDRKARAVLAPRSGKRVP
ncbi:MAG: lipopolysaccharide transport periplasmic protein LptA [Deltaproteobacteria bacterium]|nr:lipopolysaccharide transport periplasmic protein LptA [Deltaproteobacteria bacterium]